MANLKTCVNVNIFKRDEATVSFEYILINVYKIPCEGPRLKNRLDIIQIGKKGVCIILRVDEGIQSVKTSRHGHPRWVHTLWGSIFAGNAESYLLWTLYLVPSYLECFIDGETVPLIDPPINYIFSDIG